LGSDITSISGLCYTRSFQFYESHQFWISRVLFSYLLSSFQMLLQDEHYINSITETAVTCLQSYYDRSLINNFIPKKKEEKGIFFKYVAVFSNKEYTTNHSI